MRKKLLILLLTIVSAVCLCVGISACNGNNSNTEHVHSMTHYSAVDATETTDGNTEYWYCSGCGKYFSDSNGKTEISQSETVIPATGTGSIDSGSSGSGDSSTEGSTEGGSTEGGSTEGGSTEGGSTEGGSTEGGSTEGGSTEENPSAHTHTLVYTEKVEATCAKEGNTEYWYCSDCKKYFSDESGTTEIALADTVIEKLAHTVVTDEAVAATCTSTGLTEGSHCSVCGTVIVVQEVTEKLAHTVVIDEAVAATCTSTGLTEGSHCSVCNTVIVAQEVTEKLEHAVVVDEAIAATCTSTGLTEGSHCSVCNTVIVAQEVTEKLEHTPAEAVKEDGVEATCGTVGYYYEVIKCSVCSEEISCEKVTIPATGDHIYGNDNTCTLCGAKKSSKGLGFMLSDDKTYYIVIGIGTCTDTDIVIPDTYNGLPVAAIDDYSFYGCTSLTSITIGSNVTSIGECAFCECTSLASVTIPDSVTSIGDYAFSNCTSITSVTIGNRVTFIGSAFNYCTSLSNVYYNGTEEEWNAISLSDTYSDFTYYGATIYYYSATQPMDSGNYWHYVNGEIVIWDIAEHTEHTYDGYSYDDNGHWQVCTACGETTEVETHSYGDDDICTICGYVKVDGSEGLEYTLSDDETYYIVSGIGDCTDTDIVIPSSYNGLPVEAIGSSAFQNCTSLKSIIIPNSVTDINEYAFGGCTSLTSVTISDSVTSIGSWVFVWCYSLTSVNIPDSVTSIGYHAFVRCTSLTSVYYIGTASQWANISFESGFANPSYYASNLYLNGTLATDITIEDITTINSYAFYGYSSLKSVTIGNSVTSIGDHAFAYCESLTSITIPDSVTSIGEGAFYKCTSLTSVTIPDSVTSISEDAFAYCESLTSITIPGSVTSIGWGAFYYCKSLASITIGNSVTSIGDRAFFYCTSLKSITVDSDNEFYKSIDGSLYSYDGSELIQYAIGKTDIAFTIPDSVTSISEDAFTYCESLTSVTIPDSVTSIGSFAFAYCESLTSVTIPDSVTSIGSQAFLGCVKLVEVYNLSSLTITAGSTSNGYVADNAKNVYTETSGESHLITDGDYLFVYDSDNNYYLVAYTGTDTDIALPDNINGNNYSIHQYAFYKCTSLTSVTIPDSVTSISEDAFADCESLTNITIPGSVTSIGWGAFNYCKSLASIIIPDSVTSISGSAFYYCISLTSVYYNGTEEEWNNISIGSYNEYLTSATIYYYSETQPTDSGNYWRYVDGEVVIWS